MRLPLVTPIIAALALCGCGSASHTASSDRPPAERAHATSHITSPIVEVVAGEAHTCVRSRDGAVHCWGEARHGQLGAPLDGSERPVRVDVPPARALGIADHTTCSIARDDGALHCWGGVFLGASGPAFAPRAMGLVGVEEVVLDRGVGCARIEGGLARCWGEGGWLELPPAFSQVTAIAVHARGAREPATYALTPTGGWVVPRLAGLAESPPFAVEAIRASEDGPWLVDRQGIPFEPLSRPRGARGPATFRPRPELGPALDLVLVDGWACTRTPQEEVVCHPRGAADLSRELRMRVPGLRHIASSGRRVCASSVDGGLCFSPGRGGGFRVDWRPGVGLTVVPLGDLGASAARCGPAPPTAMAVDVVLGDGHGCALLDDGTVRCWGAGGAQHYGVTATVIEAPAGISQIAAGAEGEVCMTDAAGVTSCMGSITASTLLEGRVSMRQPERLPLVPRAVQISIGNDHGCARTHRGEVHCWAAARGSQRPSRGAALRPPRPARVAGLSGVLAIASAGSRACAVTANEVLCWEPAGTLRRPSRAPIGGLRATAIAVQPRTACIVSTDQSVWCWGDGSGGQLGPEGGARAERPVRITGLPPITAIAASRRAFCGLGAETGEVWCWGHFADGVPGPERPRPIEIGAARAIAAGGNVACAVERESGGVCCWGDVRDRGLGRAASAPGSWSRPGPVAW